MGSDNEGDCINSQSNYLFWGNHATEVAGTLALLQQSGSMVDVKLKTGGESVEVHRMVLCASSPYLQQLLATTDDPNPCIILPETNIKDLKAIIDFIYRGEISFLISQLPSLLKVAEILGIQGLTEISSQIPQVEEGETTEVILGNSDSEHNEMSLPLWASDLGTEEEEGCVAVAEEIVQDKPTEESEVVTPKPKKRQRRDHSSREKKYSEEMFEEALREMKAGRSLCDTAAAFNIPRTTLYMRARATGVISVAHKLGYTKEQLEEAINAVKDGSSLQQASNMFCIPKTVLWRRVQSLRPSPRFQQTYSPAEKQAAVEALERGEQLQTVASQFPIPKTTLFREKVRLVARGLLPSSSIKRRKSETDFSRTMRVEQAVTACKEGRMSQSAAAAHFQIPKTTIWRRLQQACDKPGKQEEEAYEVDGSNLKFVTEDGEFATTSLIILSAVEGEEQLQTRGQIVVSTGNESLNEDEEEEDRGRD